MDHFNRPQRPAGQDNTQFNRPQQEVTTMQPTSMPTSPAPKKRMLGAMRLSIGALIIGVAVIAALLLALMALTNMKGSDSAVKKDQYQAVFLNSQDGQVYFGKLVSYNSSYFRLTDIYYVRVDNKIQPQDQAAANSTQSSISLAKLGNELHGPEDEMYISRDKVLFWENLKEDGQVVKAIREYQKNPDAGKAASTTTPAATTPATTDATKK